MTCFDILLVLISGSLIEVFVGESEYRSSLWKRTDEKMCGWLCWLRVSVGCLGKGENKFSLRKGVVL